MTTFDQQSIPCAVCGEESRHQILLSSNQLGSPDLDLRPAKMLRSTIKFQFDLPWFAGYLVKYFDWILLGMFGNYLYYHHARRKIIEAKLRNRSPQARQVAIEKMGGGSGKAVIIILLALLAAILGPALIAQW
ncbi:MAG: hypothetical protein KDI38_26210 [Calditrichaeota bacterium]|nr:hypothetical protein [Calditrichota bacterium]